MNRTSRRASFHAESRSPETPFFIAVVAAIEKKIDEGDRIARANSVPLTDAQIIPC